MSHRVKELYSIMPIVNIPSVMEYGILSHERVSGLYHKDISLSDVQDRRDTLMIGKYKLHQYANLYFCARNPMLFKSKYQKDNLCVLRVSKRILNEPDVVVSDQNAASAYAKFYKPHDGMLRINFDLVFADYWTDADCLEYWRKKAAKCAEVLVPNCIKTCYIEGAYVANEVAEANLREVGFDKMIMINTDMFFM